MLAGEWSVSDFLPDILALFGVFCVLFFIFLLYPLGILPAVGILSILAATALYRRERSAK